MPRKTHPAAAVMNYFRTQPKDVCDLTLAIIKDEMKMRFQGLKTTPVKNPKRKPHPKPFPITESAKEE